MSTSPLPKERRQALFKETERKLDSEIKRIVNPSNRTLLLLSLGVTVISLLSWESMSRTWALEIAKNLITVNGVVLGFVILGMTLFLRRGLPSKIIEESIEKAVQRLQEMIEGTYPPPATIEDLMDKEFIPMVLTGPYHVGVFEGAFKLSITLILVSIGFSFCLFGVSDTLLTNTSFKSLFLLSYAFALYFFLAGAYVIFNAMFKMTHLISRSALSKTYELIVKRLEKWIAEFEKSKQKP
jgi:hypothetical protein